MDVITQVFISYSRADQVFARRLREELVRCGVPVWMDTTDIHAGVRWAQEINKAVEACTHVIIVLSPNAVASDHVRKEMYLASDLGKIIMPVIYQPCTIPLRIRPIQYVDFTVSSYEAAIKELVNRFTATRHLSDQTTPHKFIYESDAPIPTVSALTSHQFVVSTDDCWIAGVCGGLAQYWGVSALIVRIGFAVVGLLLLVASGIGPFIVYGILWFIMRRKN